MVSNVIIQINYYFTNGMDLKDLQVSNPCQVCVSYQNKYFRKGIPLSHYFV